MVSKTGWGAKAKILKYGKTVSEINGTLALQNVMLKETLTSQSNKKRLKLKIRKSHLD